MKYLKSITEALTDRDQFNPQVRKITELGELNLSYLEDEGFIVSYEVTNAIIQQRDVVIEISKARDDDSLRNTFFTKKHRFSWSDVKDNIIPLVKQLDKEFDVEVEIFDGNYDDKRHHTTDWVMHDGPSRWFAPNSIRWIKIKVKRYLFKKGAKL